MAKIVVGKTDEIKEGKLTHVQAGGKEVLVANEIIMQWAIYALMLELNFMKVN